MAVGTLTLTNSGEISRDSTTSTTISFTIPLGASFSGRQIFVWPYVISGGALASLTGATLNGTPGTVNAAVASGGTFGEILFPADTASGQTTGTLVLTVPDTSVIQIAQVELVYAGSGIGAVSLGGGGTADVLVDAPAGSAIAGAFIGGITPSGLDVDGTFSSPIFGTTTGASREFAGALSGYEVTYAEAATGTGSMLLWGFGPSTTAPTFTDISPAGPSYGTAVTTLVTTTGAGSFTFTQDGILDLVEAWGGGASAGRQTRGSGGGAYANSTLGGSGQTVTAGQVVYWNVGASVAGTTTSTATAGNQSWIRFGTNSVPTASTDGAKAAGGSAGTTTVNGAGGTAASSVGITTLAGGSGSNTGTGTTLRGGGGGGAGANTAGGNASAGTAGVGGTGGGGAGGAGVTTGNGGSGTAPGGGGGSTSASTGTGGAGARGQVKYTFRPLIVRDTGAATTWNTTDKSAHVTLSNGNLTATGDSTGGLVRATTSMSGQKGFEVTLVTDGSSTPGLSTSAVDVDTQAGGRLYLASDDGVGNVTIFDSTAGSTLATQAGSFAAGDVLGFYLDASLSPPKLYVSKNGAFLFGGNPAAGTGGVTLAAGSYIPTSWPVNDGATLNPGPTLTYSPPSGFSALDGGSSGVANASGATNVVTTSVTGGAATGLKVGNASGAGNPVVTTSVVGGAATGLKVGNAPGATNTVTTSSLGGAASGETAVQGDAPGSTSTVTTSALGGAGTGAASAPGATASVTLSAAGGAATGAASAPGSISEVTLSHLGGGAAGGSSVPGSAPGATNTVTTSALGGAATGLKVGDAPGAVNAVTISVLGGAATGGAAFAGNAPGSTSTVALSVVGGAASGTPTPVQIGGGGGGPINRRLPSRHHERETDDVERDLRRGFGLEQDELEAEPDTAIEVPTHADPEAAKALVVEVNRQLEAKVAARHAEIERLRAQQLDAERLADLVAQAGAEAARQAAIARAEDAIQAAIVQAEHEREQIRQAVQAEHERREILAHWEAIQAEREQAAYDHDLMLLLVA